MKQWIKSKINPLLGKLFNRLGISWQKSGDTLGREILFSQAQQIKVDFVLNPVETDKMKVLFCTMLGGHSLNSVVEVVFAWGLQMRGNEVHCLIDDAILPITENQKGFQSLNHKREESHRDFADKLFNNAGIKIIWLSELLEKSSWENQDISELEHLIEASLLKHYKVGILDESKIDTLKERRQLFTNAVKMNAFAAQKLTQQNFDLVIMSHGIYSTWGPYYQAFVNKSIPVVTYGRGKRMKTIKLNWNNTGDYWDVGSEWEKVKDKELTLPEQKKIDAYLLSRISHKDDVLVYNFGEKEDLDTTLHRFKINPDKTTFGLFTNVLWDAASVHREIAFDNPIEWVLKTIEWFIKNSDKQLILKIHPAELVIGTNMPFISIINQKFPDLKEHDNIIIIMPDAEVNSWSIYEVIDVGIVHTTTAGFEMPLLGTPCAVVSRTHFREKGFTIDIQSAAEYYKFLTEFDPEGIDSNYKKHIETYSKRYCYLMFERFQIPFNLIHEKVPLDARAFNFDNLNDLKNDKYFQFILDCFESGNDFILPRNFV